MRSEHERELKKILVARAAESRGMAAEANKRRGQERHEKQMERRAFGRVTRWHLLGYAWIRGKPYKAAERSCVVPVDVWAIRRALEGLGLSAEREALSEWLVGNSRVERSGAAALSAPGAEEPCPSAE